MKGELDMMTESAYPGQKGQRSEFGEEILKLAEEMCGDDDEDKEDKKEKKKKKQKKKANAA